MSGGRVDHKQTVSSLPTHSRFMTAVTAMERAAAILITRLCAFFAALRRPATSALLTKESFNIKSGTLPLTGSGMNADPPTDSASKMEKGFLWRIQTNSVMGFMLETFSIPVVGKSCAGARAVSRW